MTLKYNPKILGHILCGATVMLLTIGCDILHSRCDLGAKSLQKRVKIDAAVLNDASATLKVRIVNLHHESVLLQRWDAWNNTPALLLVCCPVNSEWPVLRTTNAMRRWPDLPQPPHSDRAASLARSMEDISIAFGLHFSRLEEIHPGKATQVDVPLRSLFELRSGSYVVSGMLQISSRGIPCWVAIPVTGFTVPQE